MKLHLHLLSTLGLLFFTATCSNLQSNDPMIRDHIELTGVIQPQGITSYQYGTHTLTGDATYYALKSEEVDLDNYLNQEVTILAEKIPGYPVDGGPVYLLVLEIK